MTNARTLDLSKIPDDVWNREQGRRCALKRYGKTQSEPIVYKGWDLSTVPDAMWKSEHGRRQRAKGPAATNQVIKPCSQCGTPLNSTQSRSKCPECGHWHSRKEWAGM